MSRLVKNTKVFKSRRDKVFLNYVGRSFFVHSGKEFVEVFVSRDMVGYFFGDFVITRKSRKKE